MLALVCRVSDTCVESRSPLHLDLFLLDLGLLLLDPNVARIRTARHEARLLRGIPIPMLRCYGRSLDCAEPLHTRFADLCDRQPCKLFVVQVLLASHERMIMEDTVGSAVVNACRLFIVLGTSLLVAGLVLFDHLAMFLEALLA